MLVLVVSECRGKAGKRSGRIIDSYLERIGQRTWRGRLTEEALKLLRSELAKTASRNTAVAAHKAIGHRQFELQWIVGSSRRFSDTGQVSIYGGAAYEKYFVDPAAGRLSNHAALSAVVRLAGLWHDVGKSNPQFQDKIKRGMHSSDAVRHDILSALVFIRVCRTLMQHDGSSNGSVKDALRDAIAAPLVFTSADQKVDLTPVDLPYSLRLTSWLIATHHRLATDDAIPGISAADHQGFRLTEHANAGDFSANVSILLDPAIVTDRLANAMAPAFQAVLGFREEELGGWRVDTTMGRLAIILADRHVSRAPDVDVSWHAAPPTVSDLLANYTDTTDRRPKQTVEEHLLKVSEEAARACSDMADWKEQSRSLDSVGLPVAIRGRSGGRFAWQNDACEAVRAHSHQTHGFFGCLISGTGTGKTRAIPKILAARSPELRYTLTLSLRSLTLQAGTSYLRELDLDTSEVAVAIGDGAVMDLYNKRRDEDPVSGSEGEADLLDHFEINPWEDLDALKETDPDAFDDGDERSIADIAVSRLPWPVSRHVGKHEKRGAGRFLSSPIAVSTIDQMMPVADCRRTSYLIAALRLMSSDLVIDEVDNFEERDLVAIGRLVYMAGLFGRAVLISSATMPPPLVTGFFDAYRSGYAAFAKLSGRPEIIDVGMFGNLGPASKRALVFPSCDTNVVTTRYADFCNDAVVRLAREPRYRYAEIMEAEGLSRGNPAAIKDVLYPRIVEKLAAIHRDRATTDKATGRRLSIQLVRFSHIKDMIPFALWLGERDAAPAIDLRLVVYHADFPLLMRTEIETALDDLLKDRHRDIFTRPRVRSLMRDARSDDVMVIVLATAVEEVGRDHDFDGAVIEPCGTKSIIQCCGRVERHRLRETERPNVFLMPAPLSFLTEGRIGNVFYAKPGPEEVESPIRETYRLDRQWLSDVLDADRWRHVTAISRLDRDPGQRLTDLEYRKTDDFLNGASYFSLRSFHDEGGKAFLSGTHAGKMRFRLSEPHAEIYFNPGDKKFHVLDRGKETASAILIKDVPAGLSRILLLDLSPSLLVSREINFDMDALANKERLARFCRRYMRSTIRQKADIERLVFMDGLGIYRQRLD